MFRTLEQSNFLILLLDNYFFGLCGGGQAFGLSNSSAAGEMSQLLPVANSGLPTKRASR